MIPRVLLAGKARLCFLKRSRVHEFRQEHGCGRVVKDMAGHRTRKVLGFGDNIQEGEKEGGPGCRGSE